MAGCDPKKLAMMKKNFQKLDADGSGKLDFGELSGLLKKGKPDMSEADIFKLYEACDANGDGSVDFEEFIAYIYGAPAGGGKERTSEGRHARLAGAAPPLVDGTEKDWATCAGIFEAFAGKDMDGKEFNKFCKDLHLVGHGMAKPDVDLIFAKVLVKGQRRITFEGGFKDAVRHIARKRQQTNLELQEKIESSTGPVLSGTKAEYSKFYDDKSTYTGAATTNAAFGDNLGSDAAVGRHERDVANKAEQYEALKRSGDPWDATEAVFKLFAGDGGQLDGKEFLKMCDDVGVVGRSFNKQDVDVVFAGVAKKAKHLDFEKFQDCLVRISEKKSQAVTQVQSDFIEGGKDGPRKTGTTKTEYSRFHDDKSTYTGAHAEGGDHGEDKHARLQAEQAEKEAAGDDEDDWEPVLKVFKLFGGSNGVDGTEFTKMMTDAGIYDKSFTKNDVDIVFASAAGKGNRKLQEEHFQKAIRLVARKKSVACSQIQKKIAKSEGPVIHATEAEYSRFHDDKSTYTGAHAE